MIAHRIESAEIILRAHKALHGESLFRRLDTFTGNLGLRMLKMLLEPRPRFTDYADKLAVRDYVFQRAGEEYLPRIFGIYKDIRKDLPEMFVLKSNHGCRHVAIVDGGLAHIDVVKLDALAASWVRENHYWAARELQYRSITPVVYAEELIEPSMKSDYGLMDYKFWVFHGEVACIHVDDHEQSINPFFSPTWEPLDVTYRVAATRPRLPPPNRLDEMVWLAKRLGEGFDFVRVDLYCDVADRVLFGELTFTPTGGSLRFSSNEFDRYLGKFWRG